MYLMCWIEYRNEIKEFVANYSPAKTRDVDFKMTLILKDEEPVYQRAKRLSISERERASKYPDKRMDA